MVISPTRQNKTRNLPDSTYRGADRGSVLARRLPAVGGHPPRPNSHPGALLRTQTVPPPSTAMATAPDQLPTNSRQTKAFSGAAS